MDRGTVLVVDDEMDIRIFLSTFFKANGFNPVMCRNGREGIEAARSHAPALIVLDVMMPEAGGARMYRTLKTDPDLSAIPVIMLSGVSERAFSHYLKMLRIHEEDGIAPPAAYVEKPPDPERLLDLVTAVLASADASGDAGTAPEPP